MDEDELLEIFDSHKCRRKVTAETVTPILQQLAHKEMVQEPKYIIDCWSGILCTLAAAVPLDELQKLFSNLNPTPKKIPKVLHLRELHDIRCEFINVLYSGVWVMDIV